jgi:membrane-bound lytic murein transglycosylase A
MRLFTSLLLIVTVLSITSCSHRFEEFESDRFSSSFRDDDHLRKSIEERFPNLLNREIIERDDIELIEVDFEEIEGWNSDQKIGSLEAFTRGCGKSREINIKPICDEGIRIFKSKPTKKEIDEFFERYFSPYLIVNRDEKVFSGLVTGYYVPLLNGSRKKDNRYRYPIYAKPRDFHSPYKTHKEIDRGDIDADVICWVDDRVDRFFLHIQGSGMVKLRDGTIIGVGYSDKNGYSYSSIGGYIHRNYDVPLYKLSASFIKSWLRKYPDRADEVLYSNESFIFFREQGGNLAYGSMGVNLVPKSTIAVDTKYIPLGVPIYIRSVENRRDPVLNHLFMAQDRGGAIKGVIRADLFFGFGDKAGQGAGTMKREGEFFILLPKGYKYRGGD